MDTNEYINLDCELRAFVSSIPSFNNDNRAEILHFVEVGEFGVALETAFAIALEEGKCLTMENKVKLSNLVKSMDLADAIDVSRLK